MKNCIRQSWFKYIASICYPACRVVKENKWAWDVFKHLSRGGGDVCVLVAFLKSCVRFLMTSFAPSLPHLFPPSLELYQKSKTKSFWCSDLAVPVCRCCQLFFLWYVQNAVAILKLFQLCGNVFCYQLEEYRVK